MFSTLFDPFITAAYHVVSWLAQLVEPLAGATSTAAAIILFTMAVRALLHPLVRAQVRGEKARATMAPKVKALRDKHGKNNRTPQQGTHRAVQLEGRTMFAGCLPMLIQIPFFSIMYQLFLNSTVGGQPNSLLTHTLFGVGLNETLFNAPNITVHLGLFAVMAAVATCRPSGRRARWRTCPAPSCSGSCRTARSCSPRSCPGRRLYLLTTTTWATVERAVLSARQVPVTA